MSFPIFKDLDKSSTDLINDDFDSKYTLKIKSVGPFKTTITTNTQLVSKDGKNALKPKISVKWPHPSGFTLEKLEFSPELALTVETSLTGVAPGLKLEFKGNDGDKADLSAQYKIPSATFTADVDINNLSKVETSVLGGNGPFAAGLSALFTASKDDIKSTKVTVGLGLSHTVPKVCFSAFKAKDNFSAYSLIFSYTQVKGLAFAGSLDYSPKKTLGTVVSSYDYCPTTVFKAKATTEGIFSASIKKSFDAKFAVVGSVEVPNTFKSFKWGVNATLG